MLLEVQKIVIKDYWMFHLRQLKLFHNFKTYKVYIEPKIKRRFIVLRLYRYLLVILSSQIQERLKLKHLILLNDIFLCLLLFYLLNGSLYALLNFVRQKRHALTYRSEAQQKEVNIDSIYDFFSSGDMHCYLHEEALGRHDI